MAFFRVNFSLRWLMRDMCMRVVSVLTVSCDSAGKSDHRGCIGRGMIFRRKRGNFSPPQPQREKKK